MSELHYTRTGSGEPLVLLHGLGARNEHWDPVIPALASQRELIAVELPGFGRSNPLPRGTTPGPEQLTDAVAEFVDAQRLDRPHVAGNSLGGWIALNLARRGLVRSATALSPAGFANPRENRFVHASLTLTRQSLRAVRPLVGRMARSAVTRTATGLQYFAKPWRIPRDQALICFEGLADCPGFEATLDATIAEGRFRVGEIGVPVTIAWGNQDRLLFPRQARRAAKAIPHARIIALPGCGHCPFWDDPPAIAGVLLQGSNNG